MKRIHDNIYDEEENRCFWIASEHHFRFEEQSGHKIRAIHGDSGTARFRAFHSLTKKGVELNTSMSFTLESSELIERTHSVPLSNMRSCLIQSNLLDSYWIYAFRHFSDCRKVLLHIATRGELFHISFGENSTEVRHVIPFPWSDFARQSRSWKLFHLELKLEFTYSTKAGGISQIETSNETVRTK